MSFTSDPTVGDAMQTERLLERLAEGDEKALDEILEGHRDYLRRMLAVRIDADLRGRIDPSDLIQETQLVAVRRIDEFLETRPTSFKVWLRNKALDRLSDARRKHIGAQKRSVRREVALPEASSLALANSVQSQQPSDLVRRDELVQLTNRAMQCLSEADHSVLLLRHVEELSNAEAAEVLGISPDAASKRYGRAIVRLRTMLMQEGAISGSQEWPGRQ